MASSRHDTGTGLDREGADRERESDAEATAAADEQRRRPHVEGEEREARGGEPDQHAGQAVLVRERGDAEQRRAGDEARPRR